MQDKPGNTKSLGDQGILHQFHGKFELTLARGETVFIGSSPGLRFCIQDHAAVQLQIVMVFALQTFPVLPYYLYVMVALPTAITVSFPALHLVRSISLSYAQPSHLSFMVALPSALVICCQSPLPHCLVSSHHYTEPAVNVILLPSWLSLVIVIGPHPHHQGCRHWLLSWLGMVDGVVIGSAIVGCGCGHGWDVTEVVGRWPTS